MSKWKTQIWSKAEDMQSYSLGFQPTLSRCLLEWSGTKTSQNKASDSVGRQQLTALHPARKCLSNAHTHTATDGHAAHLDFHVVQGSSNTRTRMVIGEGVSSHWTISLPNHMLIVEEIPTLYLDWTYLRRRMGRKWGLMERNKKWYIVQRCQ